MVIVAGVESPDLLVTGEVRGHVVPMYRRHTHRDRARRRGKGERCDGGHAPGGSLCAETLVALNLIYNQTRRWTMTLQNILADIHALEEDLLAFERKYGVRSET